MAWKRCAKVLIVSHTSQIGGAEIVLRNLAIGLGDSVEVLVFGEGPLTESLRKLKIPTLAVRATKAITGSLYEVGLIARLFGIFQYPRLVRKITGRLNNFDCIYANSHNALLLCALCSWLSGKPLIWHQHIVIDIPKVTERAWRKRISRRLLVAIANRFVSKVICVSHWAKEAYIDSGGEGDKCTVIYNSIGPGCGSYQADRKGRQIRESLELGAVPLIGVFGRLQRWKGQDKAISIIAKVPHAHCLIVGGPMFSDVEYEMELKDLALSLGVGDRIHFLGHRDDVGCLMKAVDFVLQPQREPEAFGLVTVEAMLSGRPIVASRLGATIEIIEDRVNGILVDPDDYQAFVVELCELIEDPERAHEIGVSAKKAAEIKFGYSEWIGRIEREIQSVAG